MTAGELEGRGSFRKGNDPNLDSRFGGADRSRLALRPKLGLIDYITVTVKCYRPAVVVVERL